MLGSPNLTTKRRKQIGGLVGALQLAREVQPDLKPLPKGFLEHSEQRLEPNEDWPGRTFAFRQRLEPSVALLARAAR